MATGSTIRMVDASGKWPSHKEGANYASSSASMVVDAALLGQGNNYYSGRDTIPSQSGSASPSMDGSLSAIGNLMQSSAIDADIVSNAMASNISLEYITSPSDAGPSAASALRLLSHDGLGAALAPLRKEEENRISSNLENKTLVSNDSNFTNTQSGISSSNASKLMTDVFGNDVIQKFFWYGTPEQRKKLANQLAGQILSFSLQTSGCRVIQKALEAIELDQKAKIICELDGHVMRCVCDQNGNHVIQKCIESLPAGKMDFIISAFRSQVATLAMHPYGCRVIQRILECCTDELQSQFIVDEILESVCTLVQDQYGNYVAQRGNSQLRSQIIRKLSGQVVQMSQHKFDSYVVKKCLEYGDTVERELVIGEIVGINEIYDDLLMSVETCAENQRDCLLGHVRVHLHALKKYTYGKHIIARFEKLFAEGPGVFSDEFAWVSSEFKPYTAYGRTASSSHCDNKSLKMPIAVGSMTLPVFRKPSIGTVMMAKRRSQTLPKRSVRVLDLDKALLYHPTTADANCQDLGS
ncbi:hypothetical protein Nepgr_019791 [Nepenthes gracilis]|uniref:PUM-HD domain-containing protein n=1 Tax=Nepenthes gracilis TaxID=150966 RepID=A0AAD3SVM4_NEPGR|nr:hypothetical protein Nepgr_019791 [Nepenthes gracilis]